MSRITFTERGFQQYLEWQNTDKRMLKRINELLKSIERNGAMAASESLKSSNVKTANIAAEWMQPIA